MASNEEIKELFKGGKELDRLSVRPADNEGYILTCSFDADESPGCDSEDYVFKTRKEVLDYIEGILKEHESQE